MTVSSEINEIITTLRKQLQEKADPAIKEKIIRLTSGAKCIGLKVPTIREIALNTKKNATSIGSFSIENALDIADILFPERIREEILAAIFILGSFPKKKIVFNWERLNNWLNYIDNWETCDQLSSNVAAPLINNEPANIEHLYELARFDGKTNIWKRRFSAATAANINHGKTMYPKETRIICEILCDDKEPMVKKAVTWALHEIDKKSCQ